MPGSDLLDWDVFGPPGMKDGQRRSVNHWCPVCEVLWDPVNGQRECWVCGRRGETTRAVLPLGMDIRFVDPEEDPCRST